MSQFNFKLYQGTQLRQEMRANPRLYQAMELVYMPLLELQQHLKQEIAENPFLELTEPEIGQDVELEDENPEDSLGDDEIDWEDVLLNEDFTPGSHRERFDKSEFPEITPTVTLDLKDELHDQLRLQSLSDRDFRMGEEIIGNIDEDGLLGCGLDEVVLGINGWLAEFRTVIKAAAEEIEDKTERRKEIEGISEGLRDYDEEEAANILEIIQRFDPPGVGGRNVRESLMIQLKRLGRDKELSYQLVKNHFDALIKRRWNEISNDIGVATTEVQSASDEISALDPKPGHQDTGPIARRTSLGRYSTKADHEVHVIPDLIVKKVGDDYLIQLNDRDFPGLRVAESTKALVRDKTKLNKEDKEFISKKYNSATWLVQAIEQRRQTMLKVMAFIVEKQRSFFEYGVKGLKPLTLREVADHIEMHESTVSRVTNEKYVQTPRGVYSLKYFFSSGLSTTSGEATSSRGVKEKIKNIISNENSLKPLTDQAIVKLLVADGVKIARRTVAKYREQLGILSARMRKRV